MRLECFNQIHILHRQQQDAEVTGYKTGSCAFNNGPCSELFAPHVKSADDISECECTWVYSDPVNLS